MRARPWLARSSFAALALACVIGVVAAFGTRFGAWDSTTGVYVLFPWSLGCGVLALVLGLCWVGWAVVVNRGEGSRFGLVGLIGSVLLLAQPLYDIYLAKTLPAIDDISTDLENPPRLALVASGGRDAPSANPNEDALDHSRLARGPDGGTATPTSLQRKYYPDIHPRADLTPPDNLFQRATKTAYKMGWKVTSVVPSQRLLRAVDTTFWFGLQSDIVVRVKPAGIGARLDIRSRSRGDLPRGPFGPTDMGRNAKLIRDYLAELSSTY